MNSPDRFTAGLDKLREIHATLGPETLDKLQDVAPDLARYIIEFGFGDIYSRPGLDLRARQIATVAALTTLGHAGLQLKVHLHAALNVGCTKEELVEVILQMALYAGFPAAMNAMLIAKEVFAERGQKPKFPCMTAELKSLESPDIDDLKNYRPADPEVFKFPLRAMIGPKGEEGAESFDFQVVSLKWLAQNGDLLTFGHHKILMKEYDFAQIEERIKNLCLRTTGDSWVEVATKLSQYGHWEFENYQSYVPE